MTNYHTPTAETYNGLDKAFNHSNKTLFEERIENYLQYQRDTFGRIGGSAGHVTVTVVNGRTDDIKTGIPPKMKPEALDRWSRARDEIAIERMFR